MASPPTIVNTPTAGSNNAIRHPPAVQTVPNAAGNPPSNRAEQQRRRAITPTADVADLRFRGDPADEIAGR